MEGSEEKQYEPTIVEQYGNAETEEASTVVVGFEEDKRAWSRMRVIVDSSGDWTAWEVAGSSADYESNEQFAAMEGCLFKLDKIES